jgi:hypothetical protein
MYTKEELIKFTTELINDFIDTHLTTPELRQRFIDQVVDYAEHCCENEREYFCFIDGLLINLYESNNNR